MQREGEGAREAIAVRILSSENHEHSEVGGIRIFAHLYHEGRDSLNVPVHLTRVPSIGEHVFVDVGESGFEALGIRSGVLREHPGGPFAFEILAVDHIDLQQGTEFLAEIWCAYIPLPAHVRRTDGVATAYREATS